MPQNRILRQLLAAWQDSKTRQGRLYQTIRHGHCNAPRKLGFQGDDCNILDKWMLTARDPGRWAKEWNGFTACFEEISENTETIL